ncbi:hypothetical protein MesoLjLa_21640 [Mesorhizobium sp. L-2-11]|nr:hypothetical protein MesoLjLa_21640 [Mesorhizobium sp. L-2-11]
MPGQENDWLGVAALGQMPLQIETARSRHAHIEDQTTGTIQYVGIEQFARRAETDMLEPGGKYQFGQRLLNRRIVIHNDNEWLFRFAPALR